VSLTANADYRIGTGANSVRAFVARGRAGQTDRRRFAGPILTVARDMLLESRAIGELVLLPTHYSDCALGFCLTFRARRAVVLRLALGGSHPLVDVGLPLDSVHLLGVEFS